MKTKLIKTDLYLLLIDEEAEISKTGTLIYENDTNLINITGVDYEPQGLDSKIIAYYPLTEGAKELDLPLLPNPFEVDIEKLAKKFFPNSIFGESIENKRERIGFIEGYKAAQSKQFSLEDVKKAIQMARELTSFGTKYLTEEIIDIISAQKLPKEFVPEYQKDWKETTKMLMESMGDNPEDFKYEETLKTITNLEGKEELVGTYKY